MIRQDFVTRSTILFKLRSVAEPNSSQLKREWTPEEDELVYKLHNQYGNKWAIIAEHLKGRYLDILSQNRQLHQESLLLTTQERSQKNQQTH